MKNPPREHADTLIMTEKPEHITYEAYLPHAMRFSKWPKLNRATAWIFRFKPNLNNRISKIHGEIGVQNYQSEDQLWWKYLKGDILQMNAL